MRRPARLVAVALAVAVVAIPSRVSAAGDVAADAASAPRGDDDPSAAFALRAATCAAALEIDQRALVERARAGAFGLREEIVHVSVLGFTFVGVAYQRGLRNPRAQALLDAARIEQKALAPARHEVVVAGCRTEAAALFDGATALERWLLTNRANARVDKFLAAPR